MFPTPDNSATSELKISSYNSAGDQIQRIGQLWRDANNHARQGDNSKWNMDLDAIWRELAGDLPNDSVQEKAFDKFMEAITKLMPLTSATPPSFNKKDQNIYLKRSQEYQILHKKDVFLRRLQNVLGKGSSYRDEFEDDF